MLQGDWAAAAALNAGGVFWQPGHPPPPTYPHPGMMVPPPLRPDFMHQPQGPVQSVWDMQVTFTSFTSFTAEIIM